MIIRRLFTRQSQKLLALSRPGVVSRFSTEANSNQPPPTQPQFNTPLPKESKPAATPVEAVEEESALSVFQQEHGNEVAKRNRFHSMGSSVRAVYEPERLITNPPRPSDISLELLLASQSHMGHATGLWNPRNSRYIFGVRDGIHIISLDVTAAYLRRAAKVVEEVARRGGLILFVGTRKGQERAVIKAAELAKGCHIFERWIPGSLTNGQQLLRRSETKVVDALDNEIPEYKELLEDRGALKPDLVVCLNPLENEVLLHECGLNNIPTIGVIDTDADPTRVTYPIPANDDSMRCIHTIVGILGRAGEQGQQKRLEQSAAGELPYEPIKMSELMGEEE
ncbi:28S ribosomal protein S2, mitochondrial [Arachnomyces sp. PD_36]|nr:28S ribosomal protein S2, mitochondrial [Arachnomyces sp. PD_36]